MNKALVLAKELENYPESMSRKMSVEAVDVMMVLFHIGRLREAGALEVDTHVVTGSGFDLSMDLLDKGWELEYDYIMETLDELFDGQEENPILGGLIYRTQSMSIAEIKAIGNG